MKLQIADEHREFFQNNKTIEFEDLLTKEEIATLKAGLSKIFSSKNVLTQFEEGRDLWRKSSTIQNIAFLRKLGETAFQLQRQHPLRIGYDQYYPPLDQTPGLTPGKYQEFLKTPTTLQEASSIHGLVCGALITLEERESPSSENENILFPRKPGNVVFIHPEASINWPFLLNNESIGYYLITYANSKSFYLKNNKDPNSGSFIQYGYSSGDRLTDKKNPIIFR